MMQNARHQPEPPGLPQASSVNGHGGHHNAMRAKMDDSRRKQRVTITLPNALLERLRNAVYWTGHGTLARLIAEALDEAVTQMESNQGGPFPVRLAPLKRGRPRLRPRRLTDTSMN